jgi:multiple sugar transport system permease protein
VPSGVSAGPSSAITELPRGGPLRATGPSMLLGRLRRWTDRRFFVLAAFPGFTLVVLVTVVPILLGIWLSFTNYTPIYPSLGWAGFGNYSAVISGPNASFSQSAIINTVIFVGGGIVVETLLGLLLAVMLARPMRGILFFRILFLVPLMVNVVAATITWGALLNTSQGWVNYFAHLLHLGMPNWLGSPHTAMPTLILVDSWSGVPIIGEIVMAGILLLPRDPMEAATVDGASTFKIFRYIVLPGIRPVLAFAVMFRLVNMFGQFAEIQLLTSGGPGLATTVLNFFVYEQSFVNGDIAFGAALSLILVLMMTLPLLFLFRLARREP